MVFVLEIVMKFWPEVLLVFFSIKQPQIDLKKDVPSFGGKTKSFWIGYQVSQVFVPKVIKFWPKHFWTTLMGSNNNKIIKNVVQKVWVKNLDILDWLPTSTGFCVESYEILAEAFLCRNAKR